MVKQVEKLAKTVDDAIEEALAELGIDFADAIVEVLDEGEPGGLLGFGRRPARVRVSRADTYWELHTVPQTAEDFNVPEEFDVADVDEETELEEEPYPYDASFADDDLEDEDEEQEEGSGKRKREAYSEDEREILEERAVSFVARVLQNLGIHGRISSYFADDGSLRIDVSGDDLGNAIGRRGETLDAIQYLTTLATNQDHARYQRVFVDIDYYRERRMRQLRQQARKSAERVLKSGRRYVMTPMSSAERRQVHLALADFQGIVTYSEGKEPKRSVVIAKEERYR